MTAAKASATRERLIIFTAALVLRIAAGALFFGSVDVINAAEASVGLFANRPVHVPYFPTINAFLWFGGLLSAKLPLPFPLSLKLAPILFDSLTAVLIRDLVARTARDLAFRAGFLYAISPVALLIISFQGQWDSIALFFLLLAFGMREGGSSLRPREFLFGALFAVSLLAKPIALPFLTLFPRRKGDVLRPEWPAVAGLLAALSGACAISEAYGYPVGESLIRIGGYSLKGVQMFGLPFSPWLAGFAALSHRMFWIAPIMLVLAILYHRGTLSAVDSMTLFYLFSLATAGLSPQYLLWPLPLLLATRRLRPAAIYTGVATGFLLLFYMNPWASYFAFENLAIFAPIRQLAWLLPPAALAKRELLPVVQALGNIVFPACALSIALLVLTQGRVQPDERPVHDKDDWPVLRAVWYSAPALLLAVIILLAKLTIDTRLVLPRLLEVWKAIPSQYAVHVQSLRPTTLLVGDFGKFGPLNIIVLLCVLAMLWCTMAAIDMKRRPNS